MNNTKRATITARILAGIVATLGTYLIIVGVVIPFSSRFHAFTNIRDFLFILVFPVPALVFGCYCIFAAYRFWTKISPENVRRISLIGALAFFLLVLGRFFLENRTLSHFLSPLSMIMAGIFFLLFNNILLRWFRIDQTTNWIQREKSVKTYFTWLALFSWVGLCQLLTELLPKEHPDSDMPKEPCGLISIFGALLLAILIYKLGVVIALWNKPKQTNPSNSNTPVVIN